MEVESRFLKSTKVEVGKKKKVPGLQKTEPKPFYFLTQNFQNNIYNIKLFHFSFLGSTLV
jgi:hypothetical protein